LGKRGGREEKLETDLVDHHHTQKHAQHEEEESVDVVLNGVADGDRESEENDGTDREEPNSEEDVSDDLREQHDETKISSPSSNKPPKTQKGRESSSCPSNFSHRANPSGERKGGKASSPIDRPTS